VAVVREAGPCGTARISLHLVRPQIFDSIPKDTKGRVLLFLSLGSK
jgi:hypothetical protein